MSKLNEHTIADLLDFEMDEDEMSILSESEFSDLEADEENFFSEFDVPNYNIDYNSLDDIMDWPVECVENTDVLPTSTNNIHVDQDPIIISVPHISLLDNSLVNTRSKRNSANSTPSSSDQTTSVFHTTVNFDTPRTWISGKDNDFCENPPPFLGDNNMSYECKTPFEFFMKIFPEKLFMKIAMESNIYAANNNRSNFKLTVNELKTYLGLNIAMTYLRYPQLRIYWSSVEGIKIPFIADNMTNNRFEEIKRNLHFASDEERVKGNGYWRVRPVLDILHQTFHEANDNSEHQAIDEMMIPFKGRNSLKQYLRNKPKKWEFKVWARAGVSGYIYCFEMHQGSDKSKRSKFGPTGDSVLRLCYDIHNLNIKLFMDNLFTLLPLLTELKNNGIFVLGTLRLNRVKNIQSYLVAGKLLPRGASSVATSNDNISVVRWVDNKEVHTISTYAGALPEDETKRFDRKTKQFIQVSRPFSVQQYNMFMGGVDMMDRMISHYAHLFKNKKWYHRIFFYFLNVSIVNAWIIYKKKTNNNMSLLNFKAEIATSLIAFNKTTSKKRGRPGVTDEYIPLKKRVVTKTLNVIRYLT